MEKQYEKLMDIYDGSISIYKVNVNWLKEQDKNARVMDPEKFDRLSANMKKGGRLESMPYCHMEESENGVFDFRIISGHHRVRAARHAGIEELVVMVENKDISRDEIISKQLSHNSLSGKDDDQLLKELFDEIENLDLKLDSGIKDEEFKKIDTNVDYKPVKLDMDFEVVNLLFLKKDYKNYEQLLQTLDKDAKVEVVDHEQFEPFKAMIQKVFKHEDVSNATAAFVRIIDIVKSHYEREQRIEAKRAAELAGEPSNETTQ